MQRYTQLASHRDAVLVLNQFGLFVVIFLSVDT
jgi:hypothetical protein